MKVGVEQRRGGFVTAEEVLLLHTEGFNRALQQHDFAALDAIYSDRYMLVRPDGTVLNKQQVLKDLIEHKMAFHPVELKGVAIRLLGSAAILTAETTLLASRDGKHTFRHIRLVAVYAQEAEAIRLVHFQATEISDDVSAEQREKL
jgi:ketosteroid isomerase-like protein